MKKFLLVFVLIFSVFWVFADEKSDDESACEYARNTQNPKVWQVYLKKFPNGSCSFEAESEIAKSENPASNASSTEQTQQQEISTTKKPKIRTYRPYLGWGIPLIIIGASGLANMAWTAAVADYYVDNGGHYSGNDEAWAGYTTAAVMSGVLGAGLLVTGAILTSIKRPIDQNITLNNLSVTPTKGGMFASAEFSF